MINITWWKMELHDRYYAYNSDNKEEKVGCMILKNGIVYCYPMIDNEVIWYDNIYYYCLEDFNTRHFSDIKKEIINKILEEAAKSISEYFDDSLDGTNNTLSCNFEKLDD